MFVQPPFWYFPHTSIRISYFSSSSRCSITYSRLCNFVWKINILRLFFFLGMVSYKKKMAHFILVQNIYIISQFIVVQNIESQLHYILMYSQFHYFLSQFIFVQNIKSQYHYILSQFILVKNIESQLHYFLSQSCSKY